MKTKAILATLLAAAAASADARLASPFPRKAVPPDESGHYPERNFTFREMSIFECLRK